MKTIAAVCLVNLLMRALGGVQSVSAQDLSNTIIAPNLVIPAVVGKVGGPPIPLPDPAANPTGATNDPVFEAKMAEFNACGGNGTAMDALAQANKTAQDLLMQKLRDKASKNGTSDSGSCPQGPGTFTSADCKTPSDFLKGKSCSSDCGDLSSCSCSDYIDTKSDVTTFKFTDFSADQKKKNGFIKWLDGYYASCKDDGKSEIKRLQGVIQCQLKALSEAANLATQTLGKSLQYNQSVYANITDFHKALQNQYNNINNQLTGGPDSVEPKGLLGLQKFMTDQDTEWNKNQGAIPDEVAGYVKAEKDYNDFPIKSRMKSFDLCMQANTNANSGATVSNQCYDYRGIYTQSKKPGLVALGPLQYLDCITYQKSYSNGAANGSTGTGTDEGNANTAAMNKIISNLVTNTGGAIAPPSGNQAATASDMNIPPLTTWAQIQKQISTQFSQNPITINGQPAPTLTQQLQASLTNNLAACWNAAQKTTQFDTEKATITATWNSTKTKVTTDFTAMNSSLEKAYQILQSHLNKNHVSPSACNPKDTQNFGDCFTKNHATIMNMVNGNTPGAFSDQMIASTRSDLLPPYRVPCSQGLAQCITNMTNYRDVNLKGTMDNVTIPKMSEFAGKQDASTRAQYGNYANKLTALQGAIMGSLALMPGIDISGTTASLSPAGSLTNKCPGGDGSDPKTQLPCLTTPEGGALAALSGMVSGAGGEKGGLMQGPQNGGIAKAIKEANDAIDKKAADMKSTIADMKKSLDGFDKIKKETISSKKCDGADVAVDGTSNPTECVNCTEQIKTCEDKESGYANNGTGNVDTGAKNNASIFNANFLDSLNGIKNAIDQTVKMDDANKSKIDSYIDRTATYKDLNNNNKEETKKLDEFLKGLTDCKTLVETCSKCVSKKKAIYDAVEAAGGAKQAK